MNFLRHSTLMLFAGALAGFLSGLREPKVFGVRGALFGCCLSLTALWVRKKGWHWNKLLPGLILGFLITPSIAPLRSASLTLLNCTIFIPVYTFCYLQPKFYRMVLLFLPAGAICTAIRVLPMGGSESQMVLSDFHVYRTCFIEGTLLFLALWLIFMWFTDPRFRKQPVETASAE